jgi:hypothetical protein
MWTILIIYATTGFVVALSIRNQMNTPNVFSIDFLFLIAIWPVFLMKGLY